MMFRLPYTNTTEDFIPENLRCSNTLDFAEAIFGKVDENSKKAIASRVFFSDAVWNPTNTTESPFLSGANDGRRVPKILSSPKPTSFQLYLAQPTPNHSNDLKSYNDIDKTTIRGSKRYWHKPTIVGDDVFERNQEENISNVSSQHTIIKPVKPNEKFGNAKVYFENLTSIELGALLTSLDLEETMRHQIGMAKPYGLGSIEIKPTLVLQDRESRYQSLFDENNAWSNPPKSTSEDFKLLFKEKILTHYNDIVSQTSKVTDFWQIPRLQSLATMLEWTNANHFDQKKYMDFQNEKQKFTQRHVLPFPQGVENNREPNQIQLNNPNLWEGKCVGEIGEENENQSENDVQGLPIVPKNSPSIPSTLINLAPAKVSNELHQYYQKWEKLEDLEFKVAYGKVILEKGTHWKKSREKEWFKEVDEFVEKNHK
jgi:RAMP superfamily